MFYVIINGKQKRVYQDKKGKYFMYVTERRKDKVKRRDVQEGPDPVRRNLKAELKTLQTEHEKIQQKVQHVQDRLTQQTLEYTETIHQLEDQLQRSGGSGDGKLQEMNAGLNQVIAALHLRIAELGKSNDPDILRRLKTDNDRLQGEIAKIKDVLAQCEERLAMSPSRSDGAYPSPQSSPASLGDFIEAINKQSSQPLFEQPSQPLDITAGDRSLRDIPEAVEIQVGSSSDSLQQIQTMRETIARLEAGHAELNNIILELRNQLTGVIRDDHQQLEGVIQERDNFKGLLSEMQADSQLLKGELDEEKSVSGRLKGELDNFKGLLREMQADSQLLKGELDEEKAAFERARVGVIGVTIEMQQLIDQLETDKTQLSQQIATLQQSLQDQKSAYDKQIHELDQELGKVEQEKELDKMRILQITEERTVAIQQRAALETANLQLSQSLERSVAEIAQKDAISAAASNALRESNEIIKMLTHDNRALTDKIAILEDKIEGQGSQTVPVSEFNELKRRLEALAQTNINLEKQIRINGECMSKIETVSQEARELKTRAQQQADENKLLRDELAVLKELQSKAQAETGQILALNEQFEQNRVEYEKELDRNVQFLNSIRNEMDRQTANYERKLRDLQDRCDRDARLCQQKISNLDEQLAIKDRRIEMLAADNRRLEETVRDLRSQTKEGIETEEKRLRDKRYSSRKKQQSFFLDEFRKTST